MSTKPYYRLTSFLMPVTAFIMMFLANTNPSFAAGGEMTSYFQPMPIYDKLESSGIWGASGVVPREIHNGLEDSSCKKWCYWDGAIIKGKDGKYHMYCSRWDQSLGHNGWSQSIAVHAVSDYPTGPYIDKGPIYTWSGGKGHNVTAITLPDGRIAVLVDEIVPATIFIANDPNGPFEYQGQIKIDNNGHNTGSSNLQSNLSICMREDSSFLIVTKDGYVMQSTTGIMGPYLVKTDKIYPTNLPGYNTTLLEDPNIWRIGKKYFCIVNSWMSKTAIYLTSDDGINNWKFCAKGWSYNTNDASFLSYTDGTKNKWPIMERPAVFVENGHVTHLSFAIIDVEKGQEQGNDNHASKIIVVPFNGKAFDGDTSGLIKVAGIGNSITQGVGASSPSKAYPAVLQNLLGTNYQVQNDGVSGTTMLKNGDTPYWTRGKLADVFSCKPNIVTIKLGTNDTKPQNWDTHSGEFKRDYLAMIDTLNTLSTKPKIYLVLPVPIFPNTMGIRDSILQKIIEITRQIASERKLPLIDCNTPLLSFKSYFPDGVHPNDAGDDSIAHIIYRGITSPTPVVENSGHPIGSKVVASSALEPVFAGNVSVVERMIASGGRYDLRMFDLKGALVYRAILDGSQEALGKTRRVLQSAPAMRWVSVRKLNKPLND